MKTNAGDCYSGRDNPNQHRRTRDDCRIAAPRLVRSTQHNSTLSIWFYLQLILVNFFSSSEQTWIEINRHPLRLCTMPAEAAIITTTTTIARAHSINSSSNSNSNGAPLLAITEIFSISQTPAPSTQHRSVQLQRDRTRSKRFGKTFPTPPRTFSTPVSILLAADHNRNQLMTFHHHCESIV